MQAYTNTSSPRNLPLLHDAVLTRLREAFRDGRPHDWWSDRVQWSPLRASVHPTDEIAQMRSKRALLLSPPPDRARLPAAEVRATIAPIAPANTSLSRVERTDTAACCTPTCACFIVRPLCALAGRGKYILCSHS